MGKIDVKTKKYVSRPTVFADLFNHLLHDGEQEIKPEDLAELDPTDLAVLKDRDGREYAVQRYRDVLKRAVVMADKSAAYLLILGVENQTHIHYAMSVRNMLYDALNYSSQVADIASDVTDSKLKLKTNKKGEVDVCVAIAGIREEGREEGRSEGIELLASLIRKLREQGREKDIDRVLVDAAYRDKLIGELVLP